MRVKGNSLQGTCYVGDAKERASMVKGLVINHDPKPLGQGLKLCKLGVKKRCKSYLAHLALSK